MTESRRRDWFALAFLAFLPTLLFLDVVLGKGVFYIRDTAVYHVPLKRVLREIVLRGEFPYWNPWLAAGQPLAANPANEVFYPLTWLVLLPDFLYGLQFLVLVHVHIAIFATYLLLRSLSATRSASIFGALSFGLGGFVLSGLHLFPLVASAAWMPLTCLFGRRAILTGRARDFAFGALALGMQCLVGEPTVLAQTGLLLGMYAIAVAIERRGGPGQLIRNVAIVAAIGVGGLLVAAVQMLPTIDHARDSVRSAGFTFESVGDWSTPPVRFGELLFGNLFGSYRDDSDAPRWGQKVYKGRGGGFFPALYPGVAATMLALAGLAAGVRGRGLFAAVASVSALLALGSFTPLLGLLHAAGIADSIRYPEKFVMMAVFAIAVFAAITLDRLVAGDGRVRRAAIVVGVGVLLFSLGGIVSTIVPHADSLFRRMWALDAEVSVEPMLVAARRGWLLAAGLIAVFIAGAAARPRVSGRIAAAFFVAMIAGDLASRVAEAAPRTERAFFERPPMAILQLPLSRSDYRIFPVGDLSQETINRGPYLLRRANHYVVQRNTLTGLTPLEFGIRTALSVDFDLTSLAVSNAFSTAMWELSGKSGDWLNYAASMSNIWYVGLYRPFDEAFAESGDDARLLRPIRWVAGLRYPRYYFASAVVPIEGRNDFVEKLASGAYPRDAAFVEVPAPVKPSPARVIRWSETVNSARIDVESAGLSFLVMSVSGHKYWTITIDGVEVPAIPTNLGYQGVVVPGGRHVVVMRYHNPLITAGGGISVASLLALIALAFRRSRLSTMRTL